MRSPLLTLLVAGGVAAVATPLCRALAHRTGFVDRPSPRKLHARPTALLGGVAVLLAVGIALLSSGPFADETARPFLPAPLPLLLALGSAVAICGLWDDRRGLPVSTKLVVQFGAATALVLFGPRVQFHGPEWVNVALTLLWVVGISNAFNLLDNMDGLAAGVAAVAAAFALALALVHRQPVAAALAAAILGAAAGFLVYNWAPASVFLGDAGSLLLGFLMAALALELRFPRQSLRVSWIVPLLLLALPLLDTTLVTVSRLRRGLNPLTTPGRDHLSHRLARGGRSRPRAVLLLLGAGVLSGALALAVSVAPVRVAAITGAVAAAAALAALVRFESPRYLAAPLAETAAATPAGEVRS